MPAKAADSLRSQALRAFQLPLVPQRIEELPSPLDGVVAARVHAPSGRFLLICSEGPLGLAFEATLFDLLAEAHFPAPRPRRPLGGSLIAMLARAPGDPNPGPAAASCYAWPPGDSLAPADASTPQQLELGRLLARLHLLGEAHPASVPDSTSGLELAGQLPGVPQAEALKSVLGAGLPSWPLGALHGALAPGRALFVGARCSAILPGGCSCSGRLVLDLADALCCWALVLERPLPALRAVVSGYQAVRRLGAEERGSLFAALRFAAARAGARRLCLGEPAPLALLTAVDALGEAEVRAAAG